MACVCILVCLHAWMCRAVVENIQVVILFEGFDYWLLNISLGFKFFFFEIVACYLLSVFFFGCPLILPWGVGRVCLCFACHKHGIVRAACVTEPCAFLLWGGVWQSWRLFISFCLKLLYIWNMRVCVCPESVRCAASSASFGPFAFHGVSM